MGVDASGRVLDVGLHLGFPIRNAPPLKFDGSSKYEALKFAMMPLSTGEHFLFDTAEV